MPRVFVFARESLSFWLGSERFYVKRNQPFEATHPAVLANPDVFQDEPLDAVLAPERPIEQASAAPGEKRATRRG
jgi:hypothetical protein